MSVELDPAELGFRRPFTTEVSEILRLKNPNSEAIAFKVKTTAPKQYCVRPNSGRIEPGKEVEVSVLLQAMKDDPPPDAKCRDKFLVQSVAIQADKDFDSIQAVWSHIEQTSRQSIQEKKIRVVFLPADGTAATPQSRGVNGIAQSEGTPSQRSPSPEAVTPRHSTAAPSGPISMPESRPANSKDLGDAVDSATNPAVSGQSAIGAAASSVVSAIPTSSEDIKAQLSEARATITKLQQQASEGLRQRRTDASGSESKGSLTSGGTTTGVQQTPAGGVPVQIVAALCLLSFLLAYFFF